MTALATLLTVIAISLLITRIATVALVSTGLSRESARFQARSAFSGAGFTTSEAEAVVGHPVRRRIVMVLMLLGNAGIVTVVSTLILTFVNTRGPADSAARVGALAAGLLALWWIANSKLVDRYLNAAIERALERWTDLDVADYAGLLHVAGDYRVAELAITGDDWLAGRTLAELELAQEGILVLGLERPGEGYLGAPRGRSRLAAGDTLIVYGRSGSIADLDRRRAGPEGETEHRRAIAEQRRVEAEEEEATAGETR